MTRSVYVIGGAGTGKSTFTDQLLASMNGVLGPLHDLHAVPNKKNLVTLRGHEILDNEGRVGLYLGVMRDSFPGTDGLDRASSPVGEDWLNLAELPDFILSEGATLATRRFIAALHTRTDLLLVHLTAEEFVKDLRFRQRGSNQKDEFVLATETRSANLYRDMRKFEVNGIEIDSANRVLWDLTLERCRIWLAGSRKESSPSE